MNVAAHSIRDTRTSRVGMAMMLLGAFLAIGGLVQTTTSHFADQSCPSGTTLIAKFSYDHGYSFDSPAGNSQISFPDGNSTSCIVAVVSKSCLRSGCEDFVRTISSNWTARRRPPGVNCSC